MKRFNLEVVVGLFMLLGFASFAYMSIKLGDVKIFNDKTYVVNARFGSVAGLKQGAAVDIAGVSVGRVASIKLNHETYEAMVVMHIQPDVKLQEDCIASIRTSGIIGDRYISILPGGSFDLIADGGEIFETESAINFEELLSKYIFEN